jgi:hypothetical protein
MEACETTISKGKTITLGTIRKAIMAMETKHMEI